MITAQAQPLIISEVTDAQEIAKTKAQRERFRRNSDWLEAHISQVYAQHRGKCICVAGQELFVGDSGPDVVAKARTAHPEDDGLLVRYIPQQRLERIYAH